MMSIFVIVDIIVAVTPRHEQEGITVRLPLTALFERCTVACDPQPLALAAHPDFPALLDQFGVELLPSAAAPN